MKWRWFWIAVAVFLGSLRICKIDRLVNTELNILTKMCVIFMIVSGAFIAYFILDIDNCVTCMTFLSQFSICLTAKSCNLSHAVIHKTGAIDYLNEKIGA